MADHAEIVGVGPAPDGPGIHHALVNPRLPPPPVGPRVFPKEASIQLASLMSVGQQAAHTRELREIFKPVFEDDSFQLTCLKMDDVVERQIVRSRHGKYIGQRELI